MNKDRGLIIDWHCKRCGEESLGKVAGENSYYICQSCGAKFEKEQIEGYSCQLCENIKKQDFIQLGGSLDCCHDKHCELCGGSGFILPKTPKRGRKR